MGTLAQLRAGKGHDGFGPHLLPLLRRQIAQRQQPVGLLQNCPSVGTFRQIGPVEQGVHGSAPQKGLAVGLFQRLGMVIPCRRLLRLAVDLAAFGNQTAQAGGGQLGGQRRCRLMGIACPTAHQQRLIRCPFGNIFVDIFGIFFINGGNFLPFTGGDHPAEQILRTAVLCHRNRLLAQAAQGVCPRMGQQGRQQPVHGIALLGQPLGTGRAARFLGYFADFFGNLLVRHDQNQLFPCPGHGHIQLAQLLRPQLLPGAQDDGLLQLGFGLAMGVLLPQPQAQTDIRMEHHRLFQIVGVEFLGQVGDDDEGIFQTLGLVDGQQLHALGFALGLFQRFALLQLAVDPPQKGAQTAAGTVKGPGQLFQPLQVAHPLQAVVQRAEDALRAGLIIDQPHQPGQGQLQAFPLPPIQIGKQLLAQGLLPCRQFHAVDEIALRGQQPQLGKQPGACQIEGRAQHRRQRNVLPPVLQQAQQGQQDGGLHRAEKGTAPGAAGDAQLLQLRPENGGFVGEGAEQNGNVLRTGGTGGFPLGHPFLPQQLEHPVCHQPCFHHRFGLLFVGQRVGGAIQQQHLGGHRSFGLPSGVEPLGMVVIHVAEGLGHQPGKHGVAQREHLGTGAEIFVEGQLDRSGFNACKVFGLFVAVEKNGRLRQSEPVDALLHIAHEKGLILRLAQRPEDAFLNLVGVLIFVHQHLPQLTLQLQGQIGGRAVGLHQQFQGQMLQIAEVQQPPAAFFGLIMIGKSLHQSAQRLHHGRGLPPLGPDGLPPLKIALLPEILHHGGKPVAAPLDALQKGLVLIAATGQTALVKAVQTVPGIVPALLHGLFQPVAERKIIFQRGAVFLLHFLDGCAQRPGLQKALFPMGKAASGLQLQAAHPVLPLRVAGAQTGQQFQQPIRVGMAAQSSKNIQNRLAQTAVGPAVGEVFAQGDKSRLACLIGLFQRIVQRLLLQQLALGIVCQTEVGLDAAEGKMLPQKALAKGVHRLDAGRAQQSQLAAQMAVIGALCQQLAQLVADALAHLPCRRVGEGHHQQFLHAAGVLPVGEQAQHTPHQNGGFACAGGSRHDEASATAFHRQTLLFGQFDAHACSSSSRIWCTRAGLSTGKNRSLSFFMVGSK